MADTRLAKVGITVKEPWAVDISYEALDMVLYSTDNDGDGCSYVALKDNMGVIPGTDASVWVKSTQAGQSIYDLAVKYKHFVGTEEEFEAQYQAALTAANDAAAAATATDERIQAAEAIRVASEQARVVAEDGRRTAENARQTAESSRQTAEGERVSAESGRVSAEALRVSAEQGRVTAESGRVTAENERDAAEVTRAQVFGALEADMQTAIGQVDEATAQAIAINEQVQSDENTRISAENARVSAEQGRVSAEQGRVSAESGRVSAESGRVSAESARVNAESARATAETARATAETARASAEATRQSNEETRQSNEATRQADTATAISNAEAATATANTAASNADAAREAIQDDLDQKANKDGWYSGLTAGSAENLVGRGSVEAEYQGIRTSAGKEDIGNGSALIREMQGKSIVWNQLVQNGDFADGATTWRTASSPVWSVADGVATVTKAASDADIACAIFNDIAFVVGHKYFVSALLKTNNTATEVSIKIQGGSPAITIQDYTQFAQWSRIKQISTNAGANTNLRITGRNNIDNTQDINFSVADVMCIDLTLMFGEGKEPTSVAEFEKMFPQPYYANNNGTIVNNEATGIKTVGFNLFNPATGKAVLPGKYSDYPYEYEICGAFTAISFEDYAGNIITPELHDGRFFNVPAPGVLTVTGGNATDTCVHLVWSGWRNYGEPDYVFEPYWENILQLNLKTITGKVNGEGASVVIFPDGARSAGSAYDYLIVDADGYARKAVKVVNSIDLGTRNWGKNATYDNVSTVSITGKRLVSGAGESNLVCSKYVAKPRDSYANLSALDKIIAEVRTSSPSAGISIADADFVGKTGDEVKALLSGVMLNFQLETPVVYTLDEPIYLGYPVDDFGTEAKLPVDTATLPTGPVRYSVRYPMNAVDAIRRLPTNYISKDSMDNFTTELATKLGAALGKTITITSTYNTSTSAYDFTVTIEDAAPANTNEATE